MDIETPVGTKNRKGSTIVISLESLKKFYANIVKLSIPMPNMSSAIKSFIINPNE